MFDFSRWTTFDNERQLCFVRGVRNETKRKATAATTRSPPTTHVANPQLRASISSITVVSTVCPRLFPEHNTTSEHNNSDRFDSVLRPPKRRMPSWRKSCSPSRRRPPERGWLSPFIDQAPGELPFLTTNSLSFHCPSSLFIFSFFSSFSQGRKNWRVEK